jgi:hypothetical protein
MHTLRPVPIIAALVLTIALAGCNKKSTVSPAAYVKSVCTAVGPFERDVATRSSALDVAHITKPQQGKVALQGFLSAAASDAGSAVSKIKSAGTPNVSNGKNIASGISGAFGQLQGVLQGAASQAGTLPTDSPGKFRTAAQALGTRVRSSLSSIGASLTGLRNPDLEKAARKEPSCQSLGGG